MCRSNGRKRRCGPASATISTHGRSSTATGCVPAHATLPARIASMTTPPAFSSRPFSCGKVGRILQAAPRQNHRHRRNRLNRNNLRIPSSKRPRHRRPRQPTPSRALYRFRRRANRFSRRHLSISLFCLSSHRHLRKSRHPPSRAPSPKSRRKST